MTPAPGLRWVDVVAHRTLRPLTHPAVSDRVLLSAGNQAPHWRFPCHCATITCRERPICMKALDRNSKPPNSRTVLVLDDDVLVRMPVVQFLRDCGYRVVEAASTDEAMAIFQKTNFHVDVVLGEIDIPGSMNGFGFAQWARSVRPELKILLAGTPERTVRNAAELCEIGPTLKRPYDHKLVLDRIKPLLAALGVAERVDLDRSRCARVGVGPCRMARVVVKNGKLVRRAAPRMPKGGAT